MAFVTSLATSACSSAINWLLLYRSKDYQQNCQAIEKKQKEYEDAKAQEADTEKDRVRKAKKVKRLENDLKTMSQTFTMKSARARLLSAGFVFIMNRVLRSAFESVVVAKIPFVPFGFASKLTHSGLDGQDFTEGGFSFVYFLTAILFQELINRLFGFQTPNLTGMMSGMMPKLPDDKF